ncbi:sigma factor [Streptomyces sp. NPDC006641]|uniref:sigma factor n=1 Tax=unclassified Streptomyces TaxID=2593676 RepID=UPI002E7AA5EC|nr:sigma factor [Streptomyces sp. JV184]MEE1743777.1 sigma factor [Streptomyces sp. JV184]
MIVDPCVAHRSLLFTVAYEMLGSAADAEDVLQETWLRWAEVDRSQIHDPRAYLVRAVFVLREVFDVPYEEVAEAVGKSPAAVRQIARRARNHIAARQSRVSVSRSEHKAVVARFVTALHTGRIQDLMEIMAPDVVFIADGGGLTGAALAPIHGAALVATMLAGTDRAAFQPMAVWLNGAPAIRIESDSGRAAVSLVVENGHITRIYATSNPEKLTRLDHPADLTR